MAKRFSRVGGAASAERLRESVGVKEKGRPWKSKVKLEEGQQG